MLRRAVGSILAILGFIGSLALLPRPSAAECWYCEPPWWRAATSYRAMQNPTRFECGHGLCGDSSHSTGPSWVDFVGGISQVCDDHSPSFWGPLSGEWDGCEQSSTDWQESFGWTWISSVNQTWDRWPSTWRTGYFTDTSRFATTSYVRGAFGSIYDLDYCAFKDIIGTIQWGDIAVTATMYYSSVNLRSFSFSGYAGVTCSQPANGCQSRVCADLQIDGIFHCWATSDYDCTYIPGDPGPNPPI